MTRWLVCTTLLALAGCEWVRLPDDGAAYDLDEDGWSSDVDCDDFNDNIHPQAHETCNDVDNNCSGDEDDAGDATIWYPDGDGDGYGDPGGWVTACDAPLGYVQIPLDCDDTDDGVSPSAIEEDCEDPRDYNCDGFPAAFDGDGDGWSSCVDCNDSDAAVSPSASERCNGVDDDCNALVDDGELPTQTWWLDADADGWGGAEVSLDACSRPEGFSATDTDCDDADPTLHPDAPEACDGADNDCDTLVDELDRFGNDHWFADADGDGHGDPLAWEGSCSPVDGHVAVGDDCDDANAAIGPDVPEVCDGVDQDCDGAVDDAPSDPGTWYRDADRDGWGDADDVSLACDAPATYVATAGDCDDGNSAIHPDGAERCGGGDEDCDGAIDEDGAADGTSWYADADGDGWGDDADVIVSCAEVADRVASGGDCDDGDVAYYPGALEIDCRDPADYNCDGSSGRDDLDGDGWAACQDCDDGAADIGPDGIESCNDTDDDCDGEIDEDAVDAGTWYPDGDGDGYGDGAGALAACDPPAGYLADHQDCDDADAAVSPAATESCATAADDDCDGDSNSGAPDCTVYYIDADGDGYGDGGACLCEAEAPWTAALDGDCDDADPETSPVGVEACGDGTDNDCDGLAPGCGVAGELALADAAKTTGLAAGDGFGFALASAGDLDGDGYTDLLVGAPTADAPASGAGAVYLLAGPLADGGSAADAVETWVGEAADDNAGRALAMGDLDGDGEADLVVGAPFEDAAGGAAGAVYLVLGPLSGGSLAGADAKQLGTDGLDNAGYALAVVPDTNLDGTAELAVGAFRESADSASAGAVYLYDAAPSGTGALASAAATLVGNSSSDFFGRSLASGDLDGDGLGDLLVSAYGDDGNGTDSGTVYVFSGPLSGLVTTAMADGTRYGASRGDAAGLALAAGDIDGDGYDDLVIGATNNDDAGTNAGGAWLVLGPVTGTSTLGGDATLLGEAANDRAGAALAVGDLDDDGHGDIVASSAGNAHGGTGAVHVAYGPLSGTMSLSAAEALALGEDTDDDAGNAVLVPGDTDGDGYLDLLVTASEEDSLATDAGALYLLAGGPGL